MRYPVAKVFITQKWGVNPESYARFGLKGHNGIDLRAFLPNGERCYEGGKSEVFAPHDGTVIENLHDTNGYGWYVKIENNLEGSILAHFSHQSKLKVGQKVKQGDFVGFQGSTGNSTGIHLHWGYYPIPRDRANGYSGTIDPLPLLEQKGTMVELDSAKFEELVTKATAYDSLAAKGVKSVEDLKAQLMQAEKKGYEKAQRERDEALRNLAIELEVEKENYRLLADKLKECERQGGKVLIDTTVEIAGITWTINGIEVSSDGSVRANYRKK